MLILLFSPTHGIVRSTTHRLGSTTKPDRTRKSPLPERFITAEDVMEGKPRTVAYLKAAEILGVPPEAYTMIEDAPSGIQAAGMTVGATTHDRDELSESDAMVDSLAAVRVSPGAGPRFEVSVPD